MNAQISPVYLDDLDYVSSRGFVDWNKLENATVLITGASGLIGSALTNALMYVSQKKKLGIKVIACVRSVERAKKRIFFEGDITYIESSIEELKEVSTDITYIIHAANPTSSRFFVQNPVETIETAVLGTRNVLNIAKDKGCKGFVFLSSMEVYGHPIRGSSVVEKEVGSFDPTVIRNCYPLSKLLCESMVAAYASEHMVPGMVARLTQTFGPGVDYQDSRIFAEFARCVIEDKDIVLHSDGKTERCYVYLAEAVTAILTILLEGTAGETYTVANSDTYCSIREMAEIVAHEVSGDKISVRFEMDGIDRGYADTLYMKLNTEKLNKLGWVPDRELKEMYARMIEGMRHS